MELLWPSLEHLPGYLAALRQGWSPDNLRAEAAQEEIDEIERDPAKFIAGQVDRVGAGQVTLPNGKRVPRLPGYHKWMWDGEFCGQIGFRWQPGTAELPPYCLGHIGYAVVPWKRGRGYATKALALLLPQTRLEGLPYVEITTDESNTASRHVIEANGGRLVARFDKPADYGGAPSLRYRIYFDTQSRERE
jgi:predicted acetyltransferase